MFDSDEKGWRSFRSKFERQNLETLKAIVDRFFNCPAVLFRDHAPSRNTFHFLPNVLSIEVRDLP